MKIRKKQMKTFTFNGKKKYEEVVEEVDEWVERNMGNLSREATEFSISHSITHVTLSSSSIGGSGEWKASVIATWTITT
ncbi:MAG: hypothetical protein QG580_390 [Patescibacteria group bacterium]|jgi:hypothetical protein|nr:hypothetical protein [Patescibacteria group bacterium]